jgi:hypothetical protein
VRRIGQERRRETAGWIALAFGLLLLAVMVHGAGLGHHSAGHSAAVGLFLLVPIFLFGAVDPMLSLWGTDWLGAALVPAEPVRAALFGRPPPLELF